MSFEGRPPRKYNQGPAARMRQLQTVLNTLDPEIREQLTPEIIQNPSLMDDLIKEQFVLDKLAGVAHNYSIIECIKYVRTETGAGLKLAKFAVEFHDYDVDAAVEFINTHGHQKALVMLT